MLMYSIDLTSKFALIEIESNSNGQKAPFSSSAKRSGGR